MKKHKIAAIVYDCDNFRVCGRLLGLTRYYAKVAVQGRTHMIPLDRLRSGVPSKLKNLVSYRHVCAHKPGDVDPALKTLADRVRG